MHLSRLVAVMTIGSLLVGTYSSAADRSASNSQRYRIHVANEVKFGRVELPLASEPMAESTEQDTESLLFMAETTSGLTIQFEAKSELRRNPPLELTVGDSQRGGWLAKSSNASSESTSRTVAKGTSVQASTPRAGWTTLKIGTSISSVALDESMMTIVVTIVPH